MFGKFADMANIMEKIEKFQAIFEAALNLLNTIRTDQIEQDRKIKSLMTAMHIEDDNYDSEKTA